MVTTMRMMRTTSLLSVISFEELLRATNMIINQTFRPLELYAVAALWYLAMATVWMAVQAVLERRAALDPPPGGGLARFLRRSPPSLTGQGSS